MHKTPINECLHNKKTIKLKNTATLNASTSFFECFISLSICSNIKMILGENIVKRTDSLETRTELAVLRTYVENQAILEPILLYWASKCKQTKE